MVGYPKNLNTKEDYEYVRLNFPKEMWEKDFRKLLDSVRDWFFINNLVNEEDGIVDDTHKVVKIEEHEDNSVEREFNFIQYEYKVNPNCKLIQIGYTEEEVKSILGE